mgnify:CR=1 FL=1
MDTRKAVKTYHRNLAIVLAIIVAIFAAIPLVVDNPYIINIFVLTFYMSTLSMAWNILGGITGQNSLGLAAYMGLGAYVCCLVVTKTGMNPWVAAVLDMLVVGVVAGVIFFPSLILRGPYFTLVSIAFAESIRQFIINSEFFGRASGVGLPFGKDSFAQFRFTSKVPYYYIGFIMMVGVYLIMKKIGRSKLGFALRTIREDEDAAAAIGIGLQSFCIPGSVADDRKVGLGHGNLGAMLLKDETECFAFLAGHESFAAAEGAIGIVRNANKARKEPLRVILNGLGKDAAMIISRINGFTYVQTKYDYLSADVKEDHALTIVNKTAYSTGDRSKVNCYGADDVREGVAIMWHENVDVSITGNSTNPTRFQHPTAGTYKKERLEAGKKYFSVASGGGTGRTLHPDNMAAGPASYGMTDTMGRMHSDAQFAGSSSVPAHVEMMGFLGMGNNPMVGATVAVAVAVEEAMK